MAKSKERRPVKGTKSVGNPYKSTIALKRISDKIAIEIEVLRNQGKEKEARALEAKLIKEASTSSKKSTAAEKEKKLNQTLKEAEAYRENQDGKLFSTTDKLERSRNRLLDSMNESRNRLKTFEDDPNNNLFNSTETLERSGDRVRDNINRLRGEEEESRRVSEILKNDPYLESFDDTAEVMGAPATLASAEDNAALDKAFEGNETYENSPLTEGFEEDELDEDSENTFKDKSKKKKGNIFSTPKRVNKTSSNNPNRFKSKGTQELVSWRNPEMQSSSSTKSRNNYLLENSKPGSALYRLAGTGEDIKSEEDLRRVAKRLNISPEQIANELDARDGEGITGTRNYGKDDYRNLRNKTFESFSKVGKPSTSNTVASKLKDIPTDIPLNNEKFDLKKEPKGKQKGTKKRQKFNRYAWKAAGQRAIGNLAQFEENIAASRAIDKIKPVYQGFLDPVKSKLYNPNNELKELENQEALTRGALGKGGKDQVLGLLRANKMSSSNKVINRAGMSNLATMNKDIETNSGISKYNKETLDDNKLTTASVAHFKGNEKQKNIGNVGDKISNIAYRAEERAVANDGISLDMSLMDPRKYDALPESLKEKYGYYKKRKGKGATNRRTNIV